METLSRLQKSCEEKLEKITKLENLIVEKQAKLEKLEYVNDLKLEVLDLEIKDGSLNKELLLLEKEIKKEEEKHEMLLEKSNKILMAKEGLQDMVLNIREETDKNRKKLIKHYFSVKNYYNYYKENLLMAEEENLVYLDDSINSPINSVDATRLKELRANLTAIKKEKRQLENLLLNNATKF